MREGLGELSQGNPGEQNTQGRTDQDLGTKEQRGIDIIVKRQDLVNLQCHLSVVTTRLSLEVPAEIIFIKQGPPMEDIDQGSRGTAFSNVLEYNLNGIPGRTVQGET